MSTAAPGCSSRYGATVRHPSAMLSPALAAVAGETPAGGFTRMASADGTRTTSASTPPPPPPAAPIPYIDVRGTAGEVGGGARPAETHPPPARRERAGPPAPGPARPGPAP